jgi:hypothetical protein
LTNEMKWSSTKAIFGDGEVPISRLLDRALRIQSVDNSDESGRRVALENYQDMSNAIARVVGCSELNMPVPLDWRAYKLLSGLRPVIMAAAAM